MKNIYFLICIFFYIGIGNGNAQYTKLFDFNGQNGDQIPGSLTLSGNVLYGMTNGGGTNSFNGGVIFSINTDGSGYSKLFNFSDTSGLSPYGSLILSGNVLYGMTIAYGLSGQGTIFSINTDGSGFNVLHNFTGGEPNGSLIISGNVLYGMTYRGGGNGNIFSININGNGYTVLHSFNGLDGRFPLGDLTLSGNVLYGMTAYGGTTGDGNIFSINTNGSGYQNLFNFNGSNGQRPLGSLTLLGSKLYGQTSSGGINFMGNIFCINIDGSGYIDLFDFDGINGRGPRSRLIPAGNIFYGTTDGGGTNNKGNIFSINNDGSDYKNVFEFNGLNGNLPRGSLAISGTHLYGTTTIGGTFDKGTIFSFNDVRSVSICMVTVDDSSKYNKIIWEKPIVTSIDSFIIFRETTTNNYQKIGSVPYSGLSEFVDTAQSIYFPFTGDPNTGTYRYKIQVQDTSGNYSSLSPYHNTIYTTQTGGTFNWNQYEIEGQPIPVPSLSAYVLYRDDNSNGNWHAITGVAGTQTSVTDPNFASFSNGSWRLETMWEMTCSSNTSRSNVKGKAINSPVENQLRVSVYPNPANKTNSINLICENVRQATLKISNVLGKTVYTENIDNILNSFTKQIDLSFLPKGTYFIELFSSSSAQNMTEIKKIVLQ